ncbi:pirin family protein [Caulobacter sp. 17J80-11]|uniref:pirin family protein n=1 Tax=Caulobacter sp. 17J80-11 TaxID=2763502 RepID=UPI0016534885|nr:pirin family protein [Caulobacter sp. 17J80-11]MBC6982244.1 pirin family protein [Caulobacter sp. 17J80-11]
MAERAVLKVVKGMAASDGAGVRLTRILGTPEAQMFDPFLMLDYFDTAEASDYVGGFPDHPHRGFETVTYMLEGRMRHADNQGNAGVIETGGIQWMRAGKGLVHSEMPEQAEGRMSGFQLWVNLPRELKMSAPAYQEFDAPKIPVESRDGGASVKVVAGRTAQGTAGPVSGGAVDALYFDVTLPQGAVFEEPVATDRAAMLVVFDGAVRVGGQVVSALGAAFLGEGDTIKAESVGDWPARFLVLAGRPIREPVAWGGPFVMNSREEVQQAFEDFRAGRF